MGVRVAGRAQPLALPLSCPLGLSPSLTEGSLRGLMAPSPTPPQVHRLPASSFSPPPFSPRNTSTPIPLRSAPCSRPNLSHHSLFQQTFAAFPIKSASPGIKLPQLSSSLQTAGGAEGPRGEAKASPRGPAPTVHPQLPWGLCCPRLVGMKGWDFRNL